MLKVCVVIPTKNEQESIAGVITEIERAFDPEQYEKPTIVVVDDSNDDTRRRAQECGAKVLIGGGQGLGMAMYNGLKAAAGMQPDFIVAVDGDGQADADEIPRFMKPLLDDEADIVLGSRFMNDGLVKYHYKFINRLGTVILSRILKNATGMELTDSHGGLRAMRTAVARELEMLGTHTYVQETIIDAAEKGFRIKEIPSVWKKREHGESRVVGNIPKYVFYTLPTLLLRNGQHIRTLYSGGIGLVAIALLYFMGVMWQAGFDLKATGDRVPAFVWMTLLISLGCQCFFFGLMLQLLKQMKYRLDRTEHERSSGWAAFNEKEEANWLAEGAVIPMVKEESAGEPEPDAAAA